VDAIVKNDLIDICIDKRRTLISRIPKFGGDRLFLFAQNANVTFESIEGKPLF